MDEDGIWPPDEDGGGGWSGSVEVYPRVGEGGVEAEAGHNPEPNQYGLAPCSTSVWEQGEEAMRSVIRLNKFCEVYYPHCTLCGKAIWTDAERERGVCRPECKKKKVSKREVKKRIFLESNYDPYGQPVKVKAAAR